MEVVNGIGANVGVGVRVTVGSGTDVTGSRGVATLTVIGAVRRKRVMLRPRLSLSTERGFSTWTE